jgi:PAS domain S-box-containing protein
MVNRKIKSPISKSQRVETAGSNSCEQLRIFAEQMPAGVAMFDRQMRYLLASRRWRVDWGLENQDLTGRSHCEVFPNPPEIWREIYENCLAGGVERCGESRTVRADGSVVRVLWKATPWRQQTGEIGGLIVSAEFIPPPPNTEETPPETLAEARAGAEATGKDTVKFEICETQLEWQLTSGTFTSENFPVILMWTDTTLASLMAGFQAMVGTKRFSLALQSLGRKSVEGDWQIISQFSDFREGFAALAKLAPGAGWGNWQLLSIDKKHKTCYFRLAHNWEGRYQKALGVCWGSSFMAGKMAGYCSKLFGINCWAEQTAFIARGDEFDGFVVAPSDRNLEEEIDKLLETDEATRADMAVALQKLQQEIAERKQAQEELDRFFNISFDMLCIAGFDGYFRRVNPAFEKNLGYTREELLAKPFLDFVHTEKLAATLNEMCELSTGTTALNFENRYRCKDGSYKWLAWTAVPVLEEGLIYAVGRDITLAKQAEEALRESEARFQKLAANVPGMLYQYRLNADGFASFTYASRGCRDLYEVEPETLQQSGSYQFVHPDDCPVLRESIAESARTLQSWNWEWRIITPSGKIKWVRAASRPETQASGDILWDGLLMDITERKLAEEALRKSEANLAAAQKLAHCGSWEFDAVAQKISWSEEIFRIYGLDPERPEPTYSEHIEMIHPDDRQFWEQTVGQGLYEGKAYEFEFRAVRPDGAVRHVWGQGQPVLNSEGRVIQLFGTVLDITDRKTAEIALRKYQDHLEDLVAARTEELALANQQLQEEIAERQQASEALRQSEARLQRLAANLPGMIYQFLLRADGSRCFPYVSSGCRDLYELEPEEVQHNPELLFEMIHPDDLQSLESAIAVSAQTLQPASWSGRIVTLSGRTKWVQIIARSEKQAGGDILWDGLTIDITHRVQADAALRESEQRLRTVINNAPLILYGIDSTGIFTFSEGKGLEGMGLQPGEVVGQSVFELYQSVPNVLEAIRLVLREGVEGNCSAYIGSVVYDNRVTPLWGENGEVVGLIGVAIDITERVRAESALRESEARERERADQLQGALQELQRTQAQLVQSEKMSSLGQLVAGVAHEINNPVSFIYGNIDPARDYIQDLLQLLELYRQHYPVPAPAIQDLAESIDLDFLVSDLPKLLGSMKMGAERIRDIVLSLRNFSRLDEAAMKRVDIHDGIDSTLRLLQNRLKETGGHPAIQVIKEYGNLPEVECYAGQLNQVFMNILTNAIDALETQPFPRVIRIRTEVGHGAWGMGHGENSSQCPMPNAQCPIPNSQFVRIAIADNGPGMTEEVIRKLFDPFFTTKPVGKGTGLGMSISYQIVVEKHRGSLVCVSAPGQGAEFVIAIPVRQQH